MDVFDLFAKLTLDDGQYRESLQQDSEAGSNFGSKLKGALGTAGKVGAAALGAVTAASAAFSGVLVKGVSDVASYGDNIDKMSQKMGMSAQAYQEWDAVMQHSGTSMETMKASMKTLANAAETGSDAFQKLGISQQELQELSQEQLFERTISALQNVGDETERTYLAGKTLGKGATELGALLNTSAEDTQAMRDRVRELGGVMSDDAVKAAAAYQDQLQDMQTAISGITRSVTSSFLPGVTQVMAGLTEIFSGNGEGGVGMVTEGINQIVENINSGMPQIMGVVGNIFTALSSAIMQNLPTIVGSGTQILINLTTGMIESLPEIVSTVVAIAETVVQTLIDNAPAFLDAGVNLIEKLADGIGDNPEQAVTAIFNVLSRVVQTIMQNLPQFLSKGVEIVGRIAQGILNNLPAIMGAIGQGMSQLLSTIIKNLPQFLQQGITLIGKVAAGIIQGIPNAISAILSGITQMKSKFTGTNWSSIGSDIMNGIANGIRNGLSNALNAMADAAKSVLQKAKNALGIKSPSKVFRDVIGMNIGAGIQQGILDSIPLVNAAMEDLEEDIVSGIDDIDVGTDTVVTPLDDGGDGAGSQKIVNNSWTINVDGTENPEQFADRMVKELQMQVRMA